MSMICLKTTSGSPVKLTLALLYLGAFIICATSAIADLRIAIVGDSTVADYPAISPQQGWGQVLPEFIDPSVTFLNKAKCGMSTKTFPPNLWAQALSFKPDFVLIQFGHNDSHPKAQPESTDADSDFKDNLQRYVGEARKAGAVAILVSPPHRRIFDTQKGLTTELRPYAQATKEVAEAMHAPFIDLYEKSGELFQSLGEHESEALTMNQVEVLPNGTSTYHPEGHDRTHFTKKGAWEMAQIVANGLVEVDNRLKVARIPGMSKQD